MNNDKILYPLICVSRIRMISDGDGVTSLIAGKGCPLKCKWCINKKVLETAPIEYVTAQQLYDKVKIDDLYFCATGGGVTFGGGESLIHANFISEFRKIVGNRWKIHAETSLNVPQRLVESAAKSVDSFIIDIKDMNPDIYRSYTGGDNDIVIRNLELLIKLVGTDRLKVRVPLIPEYNTDIDQKASVEQLKNMGITNIEVFDYIIK
ncbi:MAG: radical SAM protein [Acutalibacteraceae bacterium]